MNRKDFLKRLGFGTMGVIVAPKIILESNNKSVVLEEKISAKKQKEVLDLLTGDGNLLYIPLAGSKLREYDIVLGESGFRYVVSHKEKDCWVCKQLNVKHVHWMAWAIIGQGDASILPRYEWITFFPPKYITKPAPIWKKLNKTRHNHG